MTRSRSQLLQTPRGQLEKQGIPPEGPEPHVIILVSISFICWGWVKDGKSIVIMSCPDIQRMATDTRAHIQLSGLTGMETQTT